MDSERDVAFSYNPLNIMRLIESPAGSSIDQHVTRQALVKMESANSLSSLNIAQEIPKLLQFSATEPDVIPFIQNIVHELCKENQNLQAQVRELVDLCDTYAEKSEDEVKERRNEILAEFSKENRKSFMRPMMQTTKKAIQPISVEGGPVLPKPIKESPEKLKKKADLGDIEAMYKYGLALLHGDRIKTDVDEGTQFIKRAAELEWPEAQSQYGQMLQKGFGVEKDAATGIGFIKRAADAEDPNGLYQYASSLYFGCGTKQNKAKAVTYYKKAADAGDPNAQLKYGKKLLEGEEVQQDKKKAIWYLCLSAEQGITEAVSILRKEGIEYP